MVHAAIGGKIRERRVKIGLSQTDLAKRLGISASYLNLIERNKRNIAPRLLDGLAENLRVDIAWLDGEAERRLVQDVREVSGDPVLRELRLDDTAASDLVARSPLWAEALVALYRAYLSRSQAVSALSDRLNQDPYLGEAVHTMLTKITTIRSTAEILDSIPDLSEAERARFQSVLASESTNLSGIAEGIAQFFDTADTEMAAMTPAEEVDDFILDRGNYFQEMEEAGADLRREIGDGSRPSEAALAGFLASRFKIATYEAPRSQGAALGVRNQVAFDKQQRRFAILEDTPPATRRFQLARLICRLALEQEIAETCEGSQLLRSVAARQRAAGAVSSYAAAALLIPYDGFLQDAETLRYDIDRLARRYEASFEQVCHRMVSLRKPGTEGIPFAFMRTDPAGFITKRMPLPRLPLPRYGNACPLWAVYNAFQAAGGITRQIAEFPNGERFLFIASARSKGDRAFTAPRHLVSVMIGCDLHFADRTVYADGLDLSSGGVKDPVGPACRLCARQDCAYREESPLQAVAEDVGRSIHPA